MTRVAAVAGGLALVAALAGCNGDSDGRDGADGGEASTADFCAAFNDLFDEVLGADAADSAATVRAFKSWAVDIEKVGAPADMPDDARHGFELFVEQAKGIDDDATLQDLEQLDEGLSDADQADGKAFNSWTTDNCPLDLPTSSAS
jgi:hypothetical protein